MELIFVILLRLLVPLTIFRWPLWGGLASLLADTFDVVIFRALGWEFSSGASYQALDKGLDIYYFSFEFMVAMRLKEMWARRTLGAFFFWRLAGVLVFELTHLRKALFFAPNIFEYLYLLVFGAKKFVPSFRLDKPKNIIVLILIVAVPKIILEYIHHFKEFPLGIKNSLEFLQRALFRK